MSSGVVLRYYRDYLMVFLAPVNNRYARLLVSAPRWPNKNTQFYPGSGPSR
jgi:hypothetical protein